MIEHTYAPPEVSVVAPGDGNRVLLLTWPGTPFIVAVVLTEETARTVGAQLQAPTIAVATKLPDGLDGRKL